MSNRICNDTLPFSCLVNFLHLQWCTTSTCGIFFSTEDSSQRILHSELHSRLVVPFGRMMLNSLIVSVFITAGKLFTGVLSGYAYAFLSSKVINFFAILFATLYIPAEIVLIIPLSRSSVRSGGSILIKL